MRICARCKVIENAALRPSSLHNTHQVQHIFRQLMSNHFDARRKSHLFVMRPRRSHRRMGFAYDVYFAQAKLEPVFVQGFMISARMWLWLDALDESRCPCRKTHVNIWSIVCAANRLLAWLRSSLTADIQANNIKVCWYMWWSEHTYLHSVHRPRMPFVSVAVGIQDDSETFVHGNSNSHDDGAKSNEWTFK